MTRPWTAPLTAAMKEQAERLAGLVPVLQTPRLTLRAPRLGDFPAYAAILCSDRGRFIGGPFTEDEAWGDFTAMTANWLLRGHGTWAVETHAGTLVGFALIGFEPGDAEPELGWFTLPDHQGQGFATEAARAARDHAFATLGLQRLVSYIDPENTASRRVALRLGAEISGQLDGSDVWIHRPVARDACHAGSHTLSIRNPDAFQTSETGE